MFFSLFGAKERRDRSPAVHSSMAKFYERVSTIENRLYGGELTSGGKVMVNGLESRHDLNGKSGKLGVYDSDRGRWAVQVPGYGSGGEKIWARPTNLFSVKGLMGRLSAMECTLGEMLEGGR